MLLVELFLIIIAENPVIFTSFCTILAYYNLSSVYRKIRVFSSNKKKNE